MALQQFHFQALPSSGEVDRVNGIIRGVAVITNGISARGHNLEVDDTTLEQIRLCAVKMGQVSVKTNHKTGADAVNGYLKNFRYNDDKSKLLADWHLLKTYDGRNHILEIAEVMPRNVGLSAAFLGQSVDSKDRPVFEDDKKPGNFYVVDNGNRLPFLSTAKKFARCSELMAVDFVAQPAANPDGLGLEAKHYFEAIQQSNQVDSIEMDMPAATAEPTLADVMTALNAITAKQTEFETRLTELAEGDPAGGDPNDAPLFRDEDTGRHYIIDQSGAAQEVEVEDDPIGDDPNDAADDDDDAAPDDAAPRSGDGEQLSRRAQTAVELAVNKVFQGMERTKAQETAFAVVEEKITSLGEIISEQTAHIEELEADNEALRLAISQGNAQGISFSADGRPIINGRNGAKMTEFEEAVEEKKSAGKSPTEAITLAVRENPARFQRHQAEKGMILLGR